MPASGSGSAPPYELAGRFEGDGPVVLLVHGVHMDHSVWDPIFPSLADRRRCLAPDLRGHGTLGAPDGSTFSVGEFEDDLDRLRDRERAESMHLVGFSGGALLALSYAVHRPERIRSLTLIAGAAYAHPRLKAVLDSWRTTYAEGGSAALALRLVKDIYFQDWTDEHLDVVEETKRRLDERRWPGAARWARTVETIDLRGRLGRLRVPTLVMQGMNDAVNDPAQARFLRESMPGTELKLYPRTGHMVLVERAADVARDLVDFLDRAERTAPPRGPAP